MTNPPKRRLILDDPTNPSRYRDPRDPDHAVPENHLLQLPVDAISPSPRQPRRRFDEDSLSSLAESIRHQGVLQPVIVKPQSEGKYTLVAGERRWRAALLAGRRTIPALLKPEFDDVASLQVALIENIVRQDLTPIEEARTIATLLEDLDLTASALARQLGRSRADIAHTTRLLELPDEAIELIDRGSLTKGHGKALLTELDHDRRRLLARTAAQQGWSVRVLETQIGKSSAPGRRQAEPHPDHVAAAERLEVALTAATGCEAIARPHRQGFQILLDRHAAASLHELLNKTQGSA